MSLPPVTVVTGADASLVAAAAREAIAELAAGQDHALVVEEVGADELDAAQVVDACLTPPFLADRRVVVVRDVGRLDADGVGRILEYLAAPLDTTALVLVAGAGTTSQKLLNQAKKTGRVIATADPGRQSERDRAEYVAGQVAASGVTLDRGAVAVLAAHLGEDVARLPSLLESLEAAYGTGARVSVDELEPFLGDAGGVAPWALTDAIDDGDYAKALDVLRRMTGAGGRHPLQLMALLHKHYGAMLRLDGADVRNEHEAAEVLGMKPFPAKKVLRQARRLGGGGVGAAIIHLSEADLALRGAGDLPPDAVMEVLVARLCQLARVRR